MIMAESSVRDAGAVAGSDLDPRVCAEALSRAQKPVAESGKS